MWDAWSIPSAVAGLVFFAFYFAYVLSRVPLHWGVSYDRRLARYLDRSMHGRIIDLLNVSFSVISCIIFIMETYEWGEIPSFVTASYCVELVCDGFYIFNYGMRLYLARSKIHEIFSMQSLVDILTVAPSYCILFIDFSGSFLVIQDGLFGSDWHFTRVYLILKLTRVIRVSRLSQIVTDFSGGRTIGTEHERQILALRCQCIGMAIRTIVVIFVVAGFAHFLVKVEQADWGVGEAAMEFHDALYFIVTSVTTLGFGDIVPTTAASRLMVAVCLLIAFFYAPSIVKAVINHIRLTPTHAKKLSKDVGTGHIVIGCDSCCLSVVGHILSELLTSDSSIFHTSHVVVMVPREPSIEWQALLCFQPKYSVTYLNGDLSSHEDLRRARVKFARACLVVSDRLAADTEAQDRTTLIRALCVHQAFLQGESGKLVCLVTHTSTRRQLLALGLRASNVICHEDVMHKMVTHACLHPGFSTIWANTLESMPEALNVLRLKKAEGKLVNPGRAQRIHKAELEYLHGLRQALVRFPVGSAFAGDSFGNAALELFDHCECTLFALIVMENCPERPSSSRHGHRGQCPRTYVHPSYDTVLRPSDVGVFIGDIDQTADRLARYCRGRSGTVVKPSVLTDTSSWPAFLQMLEAMPGTTRKRQPSDVRRSFSSARLSRNSNGDRKRVSVAEIFGGDLWKRDRQTHCLDSGQQNPSMPLPFRPNKAIVIAQSLSKALPVIHSLCDVIDGVIDRQSNIGESSQESAVTVLCPPEWRDPVIDQSPTRELARRSPPVTVHENAITRRSLLSYDLDGVDFICLVPGRNSASPAGATASTIAASVTRVGFGDGSAVAMPGGRLGSDAWTISAIAEILSIVLSATRIVVQFDDDASAEQHHVLMEHVRRQAEQMRDERGGDTLEADGVDGAQESESGDAPQPPPAFVQEMNKKRTTSTFFGIGAGAWGFGGLCATMSGYASGDVLVGNTSEMLLLEAMSSHNINALFNGVFDAVTRVSAEVLWELCDVGKCGQIVVSDTDEEICYGEAFRLLLRKRDLLLIGIHRGSKRPYPRQIPGEAMDGGSTKQSCANVGNLRRTGGGHVRSLHNGACHHRSQSLAITCPSATFPLLPEDYLFATSLSHVKRDVSITRAKSALRTGTTYAGIPHVQSDSRAKRVSVTERSPMVDNPERSPTLQTAHADIT